MIESSILTALYIIPSKVFDSIFSKLLYKLMVQHNQHTRTNSTRDILRAKMRHSDDVGNTALFTFPSDLSRVPWGLNSVVSVSILNTRRNTTNC